MTVFVGIVIYNSRGDLEQCLAGLRAQTYADVRCIAVDNASSDDSVAWLRAHAPEIELFENDDNIGYGRAHNQAMIHAHLGTGDYYLALNPDAELEPNYIAALVDVLEGNPDIGWAVGKLLMKDDDGVPTGDIYSTGHGLLRSGFAFNVGHGLPDSEAFNHSREVFGAPGAAVIYAQRLIEDISQDGQLFDPDMFMYGEDVDVDWRARRAGWRCWYVADAIAYHRGSQPRARLKMMAVGNRYLSVVKNADLADLLTLNLPYMAAHCLARTLLTPRFGLGLSAHILRGLPRMWRKRRPAPATRAAMRDWFSWSAQQPTRQLPWTKTLLRRSG